HPDTGAPVVVRIGKFGPYVQVGGGRPHRTPRSRTRSRQQTSASRRPSSSQSREPGDRPASATIPTPASRST
ncbi:MAG: hypothetical protein KY392_07040, partial [Chloroflexi bacterium]|nr:hypothetical protein [Chloroflexota bacterium]